MLLLSEDHIEMLLNCKISGKMCQFQTGHCSWSCESVTILIKKKILKKIKSSCSFGSEIFKQLLSSEGSTLWPTASQVALWKHCLLGKYGKRKSSSAPPRHSKQKWAGRRLLGQCSVAQEHWAIAFPSFLVGSWQNRETKEAQRISITKPRPDDWKLNLIKET